MNQTNNTSIKILIDSSYILSNGRIIKVISQTDKTFDVFYQSRYIDIILDINGVVIMSISDDIKVGDFIVSEIDLTEIPKSLRVVKGGLYLTTDGYIAMFIGRTDEHWSGKKLEDPDFLFKVYDINGVIVENNVQFDAASGTWGREVKTYSEGFQLVKTLREGDFHFNAETVNKITVARRAEIRLAEKEARDLEHFWDDAKRKAARNPVYRPDPPTKKVNHTDELIHDGDFYWY